MTGRWNLLSSPSNDDIAILKSRSANCSICDVDLRLLARMKVRYIVKTTKYELEQIDHVLSQVAVVLTRKIRIFIFRFDAIFQDGVERLLEDFRM